MCLTIYCCPRTDPEAVYQHARALVPPATAWFGLGVFTTRDAALARDLEELVPQACAALRSLCPLLGLEAGRMMVS